MSRDAKYNATARGKRRNARYEKTLKAKRRYRRFYKNQKRRAAGLPPIFARKPRPVEIPT